MTSPFFKSARKCPRCALGDHTRAKRPDGVNHAATMKVPSTETIMRWDFNDGHKATDGCRVEPDGICPHGHQSWMRRLGYI